MYNVCHNFSLKYNMSRKILRIRYKSLNLANLEGLSLAKNCFFVQLFNLTDLFKAL